MNTKFYLALAVALAATCLSSSAATYSGNGNSGFGGPIGLGSLTLTDDGTTVSGTINKGPNSVNDILVIYVDSVAGGFADTSGFADANDALRRATSGFDGGGNRSVLTMPSGFLADYALALGPANNANFGGVFQLVNGGGGSLGYAGSANLNPLGNPNSPTYTFSFNVSQIGLTPNSGATFYMLGTYVSDSGYRSDEALPGNLVGAQGWNPFLGTADVQYTIVPEPTSAAFLGFAALIGTFYARRRK